MFRTDQQTKLPFCHLTAMFFVKVFMMETLVLCVCVCTQLFTCDIVCCNTFTHFNVSLKRRLHHSNPGCWISDGDLKTDGFSIESCRSMVAVMDVSFLLLLWCLRCVIQTGGMKMTTGTVKIHTHGRYK